MKFKITLIAIILISGIFILCKVPLIYYGILVFSGLLILVLGVINIQWNYFLIAYHKSTHLEKKISLTFDDGPYLEFTPQVLDILRENQIQATFFCIGQNVEKYPELIKRITEEGHTLGNHSFTHSQFIDFKTSEGWKKEIENTDQIIFDLTGKKPSLFRPPYGITTPHLAKVIKQTKHKVIGWTVRPYDTVEQPTEKIIQKLKSKTQDGNIILLHDTHSRIIPVLQEIIPYFKSKNYTFVTVNQLLNLPDHDEPET